MMRRWLVQFEARQRGAIGRFDIVHREVDAKEALHARDAVFAALQREGFETRFGGAIEIVPTTEVVECTQ